MGALGGIIGTVLGLALARLVAGIVDGYLTSQGLAGVHVSTPYLLALATVVGATVLAVVAGVLPGPTGGAPPGASRPWSCDRRRRVRLMAVTALIARTARRVRLGRRQTGAHIRSERPPDDLRRRRRERCHRLRHRRPAGRRVAPAVLPTLAPPDRGVRQRRRARGDRGGRRSPTRPPSRPRRTPPSSPCGWSRRTCWTGPRRRPTGANCCSCSPPCAGTVTTTVLVGNAPPPRPAARLSGMPERSRPPGSGPACPTTLPAPAVLAANSTAYDQVDRRRRHPNRSDPGRPPAGTVATSVTDGAPPILDPSGADLSTAGSTLVAQAFSGALPAGSGHTA